MNDLRIYQGYSSISIRNFKFVELFKLEKYKDVNSPLVVFGCYKREDLSLIYKHKSIVVLVWTGNDSLKVDFKRMKKNKNIIHTTWLPRVKEKLEKQHGISVKLLKFPARETLQPIKLGDKIYTYLHKNKPEYHGSEMVEQLKLNYPILIGDHSINRKGWWNGLCNKFYQQAFVGLFLSKYTGGGMGIVEMGLRGRKVITNVLDLPHCIKWRTKEDIERAVESEEKYIGVKRSGLANEVYNCLAKDFNCFDIKKMCA